MKIERDQVEVTGGVRHGRTLGGPIALQVANRDYANWEERMNPWPVEAAVAEVHLPRPGHADLVGTQKYGLTDVRNILERASARETAARVAGGAVAKAFLRALGVEVFSHVIQITSVQAPRRRRPRPRTTSTNVDESPVRCLDPDATKQMVAEIDRLRKANESLGGVFEVHRVRARARARLARLLGGAARRPARPGGAVDPGDQGGVDRRRRRGRGPAGLPGARRDLLRRRSAATTARPTAPAGSRAG